MRQLLALHSRSQCSAGTQIAVEVTRPHHHSLELRYIVTGTISELRFAPVTVPARSEELWRHTCFEAFVRASGTAYYEFNFAPTTQWAAYRFGGYRSGRCPASIPVPAIEVQLGASHYTLAASLRLDCLPDLSGQAPWHLALSAVIEDTSGRISYWALAHPSGDPDFHHADGFVYELPPTVQA